MLNNWGYSLIREEVFKQFLFLLGLKLTYVNTVDIWDLDLIGLNLYAFNILELSECPPLSHIFLHLLDMLNEYMVKLTFVSELLLLKLFDFRIDLFTSINFSIQLVFKLPLHICFSQRMEGKITLDL
jgi:hypothetical protein